MEHMTAPNGITVNHGNNRLRQRTNLFLNVKSFNYAGAAGIILVIAAMVIIPLHRLLHDRFSDPLT